MKKIFIIEDSAGWVSKFYFTSYSKAVERLEAMAKESDDIYDLPLFIRTLYAF